MPNLLAMSFEGELAPSFDLTCLQPGRTLPDGWGIGYYPGGEPSATVLKEPAPPVGSIRSELIKAWEHLESSIFVVHVRTATWGAPTDANTQPFARSWGRRDWLFAHSGSLRERPVTRPTQLFEPVGSTDTEAVLCDLLARVAAQIAGTDTNIDHVSVNANDGDASSLTFEIKVKDRVQLARVLRAIRKMPDVLKVERTLA